MRELSSMPRLVMFEGLCRPLGRMGIRNRAGKVGMVSRRGGLTASHCLWEVFGLMNKRLVSIREVTLQTDLLEYYYRFVCED